MGAYPCFPSQVLVVWCIENSGSMQVDSASCQIAEFIVSRNFLVGFLGSLMHILCR